MRGSHISAAFPQCMTSSYIHLIPRCCRTEKGNFFHWKIGPVLHFSYVRYHAVLAFEEVIILCLKMSNWAIENFILRKSLDHTPSSVFRILVYMIIQTLHPSVTHLHTKLSVCVCTPIKYKWYKNVLKNYSWSKEKINFSPLCVFQRECHRVIWSIINVWKLLEDHTFWDRTWSFSFRKLLGCWELGMQRGEGNMTVKYWRKHTPWPTTGWGFFEA